LNNPGNDAADIAAVLRRIGFDVIEGRDLDRRSMEENIRAFGEKLDHAKIALFFYAGHGLQVSGRNYLVPVDAKLQRPGDLSLDTLDLNIVLSQMEAQRRTNLIFLDACRDNPLARSFATTLGATRSAAVGRGLASVQSGVGTMIGFATQPDAVALDGRGRNSPFSAALLKHITSPGVDVSVMMRRVRNDVLEATGGRQVPWDHSSLTEAVVLVPGQETKVAAPSAPPTPKSVRPSAATPTPPVPTATQPASQEAAQAWAVTKDTTSAAVLEAFIRRFGKTVYGELARARLGELRAAKPQVATVAPAKPPEANVCARIVGVWGATVFEPNGTMSQGAFSGTWTCNNGNLSTSWNIGIRDQCKLSGDGRVLACKNNLGVTTTTTRNE
jgi:hypothetical protein